MTSGRQNVNNTSFDLHLNKRLSKQSWGWWFETLSHPLWHHCNDLRQIGWCHDMATLSTRLHWNLVRGIHWSLVDSLIARFMGSTWAHLGPIGPRWALCWLHGPRYLGSPKQGPGMQSFHILFIASLNKLLNKKVSCWWFGMSWHSCLCTEHYMDFFGINRIFILQPCVEQLGTVCKNNHSRKRNSHLWR